MVSIICDLLYEGHDFMDNLSRAMFENLNDEFFRSTMTPVAQFLRDAKMAKGDVTDIVLAGSRVDGRAGDASPPFLEQTNTLRRPWAANGIRVVASTFPDIIYYSLVPSVLISHHLEPESIQQSI
jgi:hypothetical protein